jgi:hypothetical protein
MFTVILPSPKQMHIVQMHVIKNMLCSMNLGLHFFSVFKIHMALVFLPIPSTWLEGRRIGRKYTTQRLDNKLTNVTKNHNRKKKVCFAREAKPW